MTRVRILARVLPMWEPCLFAQTVSPQEAGVICMSIAELTRRGVPIRVEAWSVVNVLEEAQDA